MQKPADVNAKLAAAFGQRSQAFAYASALVRNQPSTVSQGTHKSSAMPGPKAAAKQK